LPNGAELLTVLAVKPHIFAFHSVPYTGSTNLLLAPRRKRLPPPMPIAFIAPSDLAPRGVYVAHCLSQHGYMILFAVDHNHCLLPRERGSVREVQPEENPVAVHEELMRLLEELDPVPVASQGSGFGAASLLLPLLAFI
jgi:hypothetical protein